MLVAALASALLPALAWPLAWTLAWLGTAAAPACAKVPKFPTPGLHPFDAGLEDVGGRIAALGDFNGDRMTDLFVLSSDQTSVVVHTWLQAKSRFTPLLNTTASIASKGIPLVITNVIAGDFDYDGRLDFVLFAQKDPYSPDDKDLVFQLFLGDGKSRAIAVEESRSVSELSQPFVVDHGGRMIPSLMGHVRGKPQELRIWTYNATSRRFDDFPTELSKGSPDGSKCHLPHPHSSAFVDLNGDCLADIFLVCDDNGHARYQIWTNDKDSGEFVFAREGKLPYGTGPISFADMDADGTVDMVFSVCVSHKSKCTINIAYNQQAGLCTDKNSEACRDPHDLCVADDDFSFEIDDSSPRFTTIDVLRLFPFQVIYINDLTFLGSLPLPLPLRIGDFNNDGYPDILFMSVSQIEFGQITPQLLRSTPCGSECSADAAAAGARSFVPVVDGVGPLTKRKDLYLANAMFMDIDEDGTLDVVMAGREIDRTMRIVPYINNYYNDAFFLKSIVLNGVCNEWCPSPNPFPDPKPYGVNYAGGTLKYTVLDTNGRRRATQIPQLPQSAYMALHTPYMLFGLGRTNNYIEDLFVGVSRRDSDHVASYQGVIPNSQLVVVPYEPEGRAGPDSWQLELYMNPSSSSRVLLLVLGGSLALLGILVWVLDWYEKREDEMERKKILHVINYDALVVVRFADGRDDVCLDPVPPQTTVRELRRRIAASEPALADKFLRLVFRGRILKAEDTLTSLTASLEAQGSAGDAAVAAPPAHTAAPDSKALPLFLHCSVSDERPLSSHQDLAWAFRLGAWGRGCQQEPQITRRPQGFDRLLDIGMSEDEVRSLRQQFHALRGAEDAERTDAARNAEEEWMESPGNPNDDRDSGTHTDMLLGLVVGFFMGILVLFWVKEANMYNRRQQLGIVTGLLINFSFGLLRMYYH